MRAKVGYLWHQITTSFWLVPGLALILAIAVSFATLALDARLEPALAGPIGWLYGGGPDGARSLLSTVAGAMITVASLAFSLTLIALTMATGQFGPRLLQTFMRDPVNQITLGAFLGTFVYALLVLRTVDDTTSPAFVPHISTSLAVVLAIASFVWLIYFIHHVAESLQADTVIANVGAELARAIRQRASDAGHDGPAPTEAWVGPDAESRSDQDPAAIPADRHGYVQAIDHGTLVKTASDQDVLIRLTCAPGDFVVDSMTIAFVWPEDRVDDDVVAALRLGIVVGPKRTATQDVRFVIANLVEVALRALSPGINDPHTAITCIDRLTAAVADFMRAPQPSAERRDAAGTLRLICEPLTTEAVLRTAFDEILEASRDQGSVLLRLTDALFVLASLVDRSDQPLALQRQADRLVRAWRASPVDDQDREAAEQRLRRLAQDLAISSRHGSTGRRRS